MTDLSKDACSSCGVPWSLHLGIAATCAENKRLREIIYRARVAFFYDGTDGEAAAKMLEILYEATNDTNHN